MIGVAICVGGPESPSQGLELPNRMERVKLSGGVIDIESTMGRGTTIGRGGGRHASGTLLLRAAFCAGLALPREGAG